VRVLIVAPIVPRTDGPAAMSMLLQAQLEALRHRHDVTLVTGLGDPSWEQGAARAALESGIDVHVADRRYSPRRRQRIRRSLRLASAWASTRHPWSTHWFGSPSVQAVLDRLSATRRFDVVAVEDAAMSTLKLPPRVPVVLTDHEVSRARPAPWRPGGPLTLRQWTFRDLDWRRWEAFQPTAWRASKLVHVFTDHDARTIRERAPDLSPRVRVNPFGLIMPRQLDPTRTEPDTVLLTGNFNHPPNRDAALWLARAIMPRVWARRPAARLWIVGSMPSRGVADLGADKVDVIPHVLGDQRLLAAACVCAAPVRWGDGMRVNVLQALTSGKPVVATRRVAEGYAQPARALPMIVADETEEIAAGIVRVLSDDTFRIELGQRARAFAEEFNSPRAWGARLESIYAEACEEDGSAS
jgi:glycosyltransferase involved in cell wall biosynthesis